MIPLRSPKTQSLTHPPVLGSTMDVAPVNGQLFTYGDDPTRRMSVFITGAAENRRCLLLVGGQSDGFFSLLFIRSLMSQTDSIGWAVVQVQLASSCWGYGGRTHQDDAEDIVKLLYRLNSDFHMCEVTLVAWGTGVQVALAVLGTEDAKDIVSRVIFHGVVQDADDAFFHRESHAHRVAQALEMVDSGRREQPLPMSVYDLPMSAARLSTGGLPSLQEALWVPALAPSHAILPLSTVFQTSLRVPLLLLVATHPAYRPTEAVKVAFTAAIKHAATDASVEFMNDTCDEYRRMLRGSEATHTAAVVMFLKEQDRKRAEREEQDRLNAAENLRRSRSILARSAF